MCANLQVKTERWSKQKEKKERKQRRREIKDRKRKLKEQKLDDDDIDDLNSDVRLMKKLKKRKVSNKMMIEMRRILWIFFIFLFLQIDEKDFTSQFEREEKMVEEENKT